MRGSGLLSGGWRLRLLLLLLASPPTSGQQTSGYQRGGVRRGAVTLAAPSAPLSSVQCAALCSRLSSCHAWHREASSGRCSVYPAPGGDSGGVLDDRSFGPRPAAGPVVVAGTEFSLVTVRGSWEEGRAACEAMEPQAELAAPADDAAVQAVITLAAADAGLCEQLAYLGMKCSTEHQDAVSLSGQVVTITDSWFEDGDVPACIEKLECFIVDGAGYLQRGSCQTTRCAVCQRPAEDD